MKSKWQKFRYSAGERQNGFVIIAISQRLDLFLKFCVRLSSETTKAVHTKGWIYFHLFHGPEGGAEINVDDLARKQAQASGLQIFHRWQWAQCEDRVLKNNFHTNINFNWKTNYARQKSLNDVTETPKVKYIQSNNNLKIINFNFQNKWKQPF